MGTAWRTDGLPGGVWSEWKAAPFYNLKPNSSRAMEFSFAQPLTSARQRAGWPTAPLEIEFRYPKNGRFVTEKHVLPSGDGKIKIESSSAAEAIWGQIKYRIKPIGLWAAIRQGVTDGVNPNPPLQDKSDPARALDAPGRKSDRIIPESPVELVRDPEPPSGPQNKIVADRTRDLQGLMGDRHSEYWRGPKADALQQEYRDLIAARGGGEPRDKSLSFDPERGRTLIGINADKPVEGEDSTVFARMIELQGLMADRHSEYWRGPKADVLQQEYRDLVELRDKDKLRDEELSRFAATL